MMRFCTHLLLLHSYVACSHQQVSADRWIAHAEVLLLLQLSLKKLACGQLGYKFETDS